MADIFLSYSRQDRARAEQVAKGLTQLNQDVWWDSDIHLGANFRSEIAQHLRSAWCVLVLWSRFSIESDWVIDEAEEAKTEKMLIQVLIDNVQPPHGFRSIEWADLTSWNGNPNAPEFIQLATGIILRVNLNKLEALQGRRTRRE